ncbi:Pattern-formation protein/guanine nucleotide exchange factor [Trachipleistophora hominis]|uniref:Pattern-formation protein/guanine nucleotide exchange factor n=1 Tax=Trachipleistophora hominis TaxID=72359 RepID=L7JWB4_TRAHO|nr:Pattern-formation protein/guanine nucleotide exchange factor [Trachipleistophora hominis]
MQNVLLTKTKILQAILQIRSYPFTSHDLIVIKQKMHHISLKELSVWHIKHVFLEFVRVRKFRNSEMQFVLEELVNVVGLFDELDVVGECVMELLYENDRHVYEVLRAHFAVLYEIMEYYGENEESAIVRCFNEGMVLTDDGKGAVGSTGHVQPSKDQFCKLSRKTAQKIFYELFIALSHFKNKQLVFFLKPKFISLVNRKTLKRLYLQHKMYVVVPECLNLEVPTERALFALNHRDIASFVYSTVFDPYLFQVSPVQDVFYESVFFLFLYFDCEPMMEDLGMQMFVRMVDENEIIGVIEHAEHEEENEQNVKLRDEAKNDQYEGRDERNASLHVKHRDEKINDQHVRHCCERLKQYDPQSKDVVKQKFAHFSANGDALDFENKHLILRSFPLNKRSIGKFLSNNPSVLKEYLTTFDFTNLDLLGALRAFLRNFYLPTESQAINKILSAFSERYYECNKEGFGSDGNELDSIVCGNGGDVKRVNGIVGNENAGAESDEIYDGEDVVRGDDRGDNGDDMTNVRGKRLPNESDTPVQGVCEIVNQNSIDNLMKNSKEHAEKDAVKTGTRNTAFDFDSVDILTFCILCLNTDLHNAAIRVKTLKLSFIERARKCNLSYFFSDRYLSYVYDSVKKDPLVTDSRFIHSLETYRAYYQVVRHSTFYTVERMDVCMSCKRSIIREMCAHNRERVFRMVPDDVIRVIRFSSDVMTMIDYCVWYGDRMRRERMESFFRVFYAVLEMIEADGAWNGEGGEEQYVFLRYPLAILNKYKRKNENFFFKRSHEADRMKATLYKVIGSGNDAIFSHFIKENVTHNLSALVRKNVFRLGILDDDVLEKVTCEEVLIIAKELELYDLFYRMLNLKDFTAFILKNDWIEMSKVKKKWITADLVMHREEIGEEMFGYLNEDVNLLVYFRKCKSVFNLEWLEHILKGSQKCYMERINVKDDRLLFMVSVLDSLVNFDRNNAADTDADGAAGVITARDDNTNGGSDTIVKDIPIESVVSRIEDEKVFEPVNPYEYLTSQMVSRLSRDERSVLMKNIKKIIALLSLSLPLIIKIVRLPVSDVLGKELAKVFTKRIKYKNVCANECEHTVDVDGMIEYIQARGWISVDKDATAELTNEGKTAVEDAGVGEKQKENELDI